MPTISLVPTKSQLLSEEALILFTFEGDNNVKKQLSRVFQKGETETILAYIEKRKYKGSPKATLYLPVFDDTVAIVIGLGKEKDCTAESYRAGANAGLAVLKSLKIESAAFIPPTTKKITLAGTAAAITEGLVLGSYEFEKYKSVPEGEDRKYEFSEARIVLDSINKSIEKALDRAVTVCTGTVLARDLENENSDQVNPKTFADEAMKLAKEQGMKATIMEAAEIKKKNLNLLYAVGRGSDVPPRLVIMEYRGNRKKDIDVALVGKGVTFDTGGLDLKPAGPSKNQMHIDMAGAATVLATMNVAAKLKLKKNILGVMPLAENAIGSKSYKPGSIIVSHSGKSVKIENTDAEGRLILADALSYVTKEYQPEYVVDVATLTGAIIVSLGFQAAGLFVNNAQLRKQLLSAAESTHERLWELPMYDEYTEDIKGDFSDLKNVGLAGGYAGSIAGAVFLKQFVGETKWAHLDVAGMSLRDKPQDYMPINGTGFGVRLLIDYLS